MFLERLDACVLVEQPWVQRVSRDVVRLASRRSVDVLLGRAVGARQY